MAGISNSIIDKRNERLWKMRYSDPVKVVEEAKKLLSKAESNYYLRGVAYSKLNIAAAKFLQSKNDTALENLSDAIAWFSENPDGPGYARALYIKGNIYESFGDYEKALDFCLKAQKLASENNDRETEAEAASQLGLIYTRLCNFTKALEYYKTGLTIREESGDVNAVASSLNRMGMLMRLTKKHDESLRYYFESLAIRKKNKQDSSIPWTLLGIASTYEELGNNGEALKYYEQGMIGGDRRCTLQCMMGAGRVQSVMGNSEAAGNNLTKSLETATELRAMSLIAEAYAALAKHYESIGNAQKALDNYKLYLRTRESVQNEESQSRFRNIEISHAIEKSEQEKEIFRLRHVELKAAYDIIEEKNNDITSSINYASRIQYAMLPERGEIKGLTGKSFILLIPRDIVSGDFYWFSEVSKKLVLAAGDCTGHGVPGALMSMLGISFLEEIVNNRKITDSGEILNALRYEVQRALRQKGEKQEAKDGMDIALCVIDRKNGTIQYSGAYNNLYLIRNGELTEYPADRMPIGIFDHTDKKFTPYEIESAPGDILYMFSDGYADQFGGPNSKKFKYSTLKSLLLDIHALPLPVQKKRLEKEFYNWKGDNPQTDDVVVVGYRI